MNRKLELILERRDHSKKMDHQNISYSNFKKFLIRFLLPFFGIVIPFGLFFNLWFENEIVLNRYGSYSYKINRIIADDRKDEIPMFGSSRMEEGLIPDVLGNNYYNYGISGAQDDIVLFFLKKELKKDKKTPIILNYDIDGLNYSFGDYTKYLYNMDDPDITQVMSHYGYDKLYYHLPFLKYFGSYETFIIEYIKTVYSHFKFSKGVIYRNKGFNTITHIPDSLQELKKDIQKRLKIPQSFSTDSNLLRELKELTDHNQARKIIILVPPYHPAFFKNFKNLDKALRFIESLKKYKNVRVVDFSRTPYSEDYFKDTMHLNYRGSKRLSQDFKDSIRDIL